MGKGQGHGKAIWKGRLEGRGEDAHGPRTGAPGYRLPRSPSPSARARERTRLRVNIEEQRRVAQCNQENKRFDEPYSPIFLLAACVRPFS